MRCEDRLARRCGSCLQRREDRIGKDHDVGRIASQRLLV